VSTPAVGEVTPEGFAEDLLGVLAALRRNLARHVERPLAPYLLTGSQLELVRLVRRRPGVSVAEAAEELHVASNTVSTLVRQLTDAGLLRRGVAPSDHRVAHLELTPELRQSFGAFRDRRLLALESSFASLSRGDRSSLSGLLPVLGRLAEALKDVGPDAKGAHS